MPPLTRGRTIALCAGLIGAGALLRLHFVDVPLNVDEAGFAQVARLWAGGERLYGDVAWADRPQGLLLLYRWTLLFGLDEAVRVLALLAGAIVAGCVAVTAWTLAGPRAAVATAGLAALLGPAPHLEGFTANGELLGSVFACGAVALGARWLVGGDTRLLYVAGLVAACGPLVKQSAFDGAIALVVLVIAEAWRAANLRRGVADLARLATGAAIPVLAAVVHGAITGLDDWWFAVVGYRTSSESIVSGDTGARLGLLADSLTPAFQDLLPLALAAAGLVALQRARRLTLPLAWLLAATAGFLLGGLYHPHYWIGLVPPLALLAGVGLVAVLDRAGALATAAIVLLLALPVIAYSTEVYTTRDAFAISHLTTDDPRVTSAIVTGPAAAAVSAPGDSVYAIWANAAFSWHADRPSAYRYLWYRGVEFIPGARDDVRALFTGPNPPTVVAVYQDPDELDPTGTVANALATRYEQLPDVGGVPLYRLLR